MLIFEPRFHCRTVSLAQPPSFFFFCLYMYIGIRQSSRLRFSLLQYPLLKPQPEPNLSKHQCAKKAAKPWTYRSSPLPRSLPRMYVFIHTWDFWAPKPTTHILPFLVIIRIPGPPTCFPRGNIDQSQINPCGWILWQGAHGDLAHGDLGFPHQLQNRVPECYQVSLGGGMRFGLGDARGPFV